MLINTSRTFWVNALNIVRKHLLYIAYIYVATAVVIWLITLRYPISYTSLWRGDLWSSIVYPLTHNFHGGSYFAVAWFLFAYAIVSLIAHTLLKLIEKVPAPRLLIALFVAGIGLVCGYYGMKDMAISYHTDTSLFYLNTISQVLVGLSFFLFGYVFRVLGFRFITLSGFIAGFVVLYVMFKYGLGSTVGMSWSKYPLGVKVHLLEALIGIYAVLYLSKLLSASGKQKTLEKIGRESKSIMSFHILTFVLLDVLFFEMGLYEISKTSAFQHFQSLYSWPIYMIAGVVLPVLFAILWDKLLHRLPPISVAHKIRITP